MTEYELTIKFEAEDDEMASYLARNALQEFGYDPFGQGSVIDVELTKNPTP